MRQGVTSISMRMRGSMSPAMIAVEAGRISPKYWPRIGPMAGQSSARGPVARTTCFSEAPASFSAASMLRKV
jgi:hypothetical protein